MIALTLVVLAALVLMVALALNHRAADGAVLGGLLGLCVLVFRMLLRDLRAHPANFPAPGGS